MTIDREAIYVALFNLLSNTLSGSCATIGRRHIMPPDIGPEQQPALFVCGTGEMRDPKPRGTPGKVTLKATLFLYCYDSGINEIPGQEQTLAATQINQLLSTIEDAIEPAHGPQTLGGLVSHCWIEGETLLDPGIFGPQAVSMIPVQMLVP